MDIFSINKPKTTKEVFEDIIKLSHNYHNLNGYVFSKTLESHGHFDIKYVTMLVVPLPFYNNDWSNEVFKFCLEISEKYPYLRCCHYDKLLEQVKLPNGGKCQILFFDSRELLRVHPAGQGREK